MEPTEATLYSRMEPTVQHSNWLPHYRTRNSASTAIATAVVTSVGCA